VIPSSAPHVGANIRVAEWGGTTVRGVVTAVHSDIKNGRPGVDYRDERGDDRWCYLTQITMSTNSRI
jgi:hypothetical protein